MNANDVLEITQILNTAQVEVWLDGGWAVDAILKRQTRDHADLDVVVELDQVDRIKKALAPSGFTVLEDELPTRFVMADANHRQIDFHTVIFNGEGGGIQKLQDGRSFIYPAQGFRGMGEINGYSIKCLTPDVQAECHYGYEPDDKDFHDMRLLHEKFGIVLQPPYR